MLLSYTFCLIPITFLLKTINYTHCTYHKFNTSIKLITFPFTSSNLCNSLRFDNISSILCSNQNSRKHREMKISYYSHFLGGPDIIRDRGNALTFNAGFVWMKDSIEQVEQLEVVDWMKDTILGRKNKS